MPGDVFSRCRLLGGLIFLACFTCLRNSVVVDVFFVFEVFSRVYERKRNRSITKVRDQEWKIELDNEMEWTGFSRID